MPTIREVAEKARVSPTTVSHVINNTRFVSERLRSRVQMAMEELGYRPNAIARSLRRGRTFTIGLILPDSANPFFAEVGRGIEAAAFDNGFSVILCNTEGDYEREEFYVDVLIKKQVDGIIFVAAGDRPAPLLALLKQNASVVMVDRNVPGVEVDAVLADNCQGGYLVTQHLIELNHRRIGCITGPSNLTPSADRIIGYRRALEQANLSVDESLIMPGDFHIESGYAATLRLLNLPDPPTAIFAFNDLMAVGAMHAASQAGVEVPRDLSIVGFDDIELASYVTPALTTVKQPTMEMGKKAVQLLIERIEDKDIPTRCHISPTELIIRDSSGQNHE
jgi:LacI family transcriptional regulator